MPGDSCCQGRTSINFGVILTRFCYRCLQFGSPACFRIALFPSNLFPCRLKHSNFSKVTCACFLPDRFERCHCERHLWTKDLGNLGNDFEAFAGGHGRQPCASFRLHVYHMIIPDSFLSSFYPHQVITHRFYSLRDWPKAVQLMVKHICKVRLDDQV